ncbi:nuclear transport factor 2 family protein [Actinokineospora iranica]|uniref:Ketosteroid isomerase-related protein n=1 Tax=Actinokineospora iranica TaxID=1271860 RepID=A0A1G6RWS8_9PSEU|nr:nuclear transport factor 2 family protein [Actinokineospora iranica]SDD09018.1 Ketosteroid isomerase-related protein [Actinokineospora iranica]
MNASLVRRLYAAIEADESATVASLVAPDVLLRVPGNHPAAGDYVGTAGLAEFLAASAAIAPGGAHTEVIDILGGDNHAAVYAITRAERPGRPPLANPTLHLLEIRHGRVLRVWFHNRDQASVDAFWS